MEKDKLRKAIQITLNIPAGNGTEFNNTIQELRQCLLKLDLKCGDTDWELNTYGEDYRLTEYGDEVLMFLFALDDTSDKGHPHAITRITKDGVLVQLTTVKLGSDAIEEAKCQFGPNNEDWEDLTIEI